MKRFFLCAIAFQAYMLTRCPSSLGMEGILAGRAWSQHILLYQDFKMHIGPVVPMIFGFLFSIPPLVWYAMIFGLFNLASAYGIYLLAEGSMVAPSLFLLANCFLEGNSWHVETVMVTFGVWSFVFAWKGYRRLAFIMVVLAALTKQTGVLFGIALL